MAVNSPETKGNVAQAVALLCERVKRLIQARKLSKSDERVLIALSGVPGSGKSTVSAALLKELPNCGIEGVTVLPMDGYHYSRAKLSLFEDPTMAFRKRGAPFTFDANAFVEFITKLKEATITKSTEPETFFKAPGFDHAEKDPVQDAICISSRCNVVIIEGNYTLLNMKPWNRIPQYADERWFVDVLPEVALDRIAKRHLQAGIETSLQAAISRAQDNDIPNGDLIRTHLIEPDVRILN